MSVVRAWEVQGLPTPDVLVYAESSERAMVEAMRCACPTLKRKQWAEMIDSGALSAHHVEAWRASAGDATFVTFAPDRAVALARAKAALGIEPERVERVDEIAALMTLDDQMLQRLCRTTWPGAHQPTSLLWHRIPVVGLRLRYRTHTSRAMIRTSRLCTIYALRLATLLSWFGPPPHRGWLAGGKGPSKPRQGLRDDENAGHIASRKRARTLHGANVPAETISECFKHGLICPQPILDDLQRSALRRLACTYGADADRLSDIELLRLWNQGPSDIVI